MDCGRLTAMTDPETQQAGVYIPSLPCLSGSADAPAPHARDPDLELVDLHPLVWTVAVIAVSQSNLSSRCSRVEYDSM